MFGVSCDEYLNYALANRKEWEARGEASVAEMIEKYNSAHGKKEVAEEEKKASQEEEKKTSKDD